MSAMHIDDIGPVAWGVILTLLVMSIVSMAVVIERLWTYRRASRQSRVGTRALSPLLRQGKIREALDACRGPALHHSHVTRVLAAGLAEWHACREEGTPAAEAVASSEEAVRQAASETLADLRRGLSTLATIGSTAPFVGLFGTTFGIINAFAAMAVTGAGGITTISSGISEALVTTAFGLFVALPAVWSYNALGARVDSFAVELERGGYELKRYLARHAAAAR